MFHQCISKVLMANWLLSFSDFIVLSFLQNENVGARVCLS